MVRKLAVNVWLSSNSSSTYTGRKGKNGPNTTPLMNNSSRNRPNRRSRKTVLT